MLRCPINHDVGIKPISSLNFKTDGLEVTSNNAALGLPSGEEESVCTGECHEDKDVVTRLLRDMQICDARAVFDSYFLSRWFKKSSSRGESRFVACFSGNSPLGLSTK
ncbi:unnamed protein product [Brassica oleracea var. botrytis]|uniref:(rape) hypothetical protein n=2 Tax=Brassica TaxID=3705 RepID=A0A816I7T3_BRANA|nr:unnamed protein product [Brassica napus]